MRFVHRSYFCGLGNGNDAGLHVVRVADAMVGVAYGFDGKFALPRGNGNQLAAGEFFGRAAFVGINVGSFAADYRVIRVGQCLQAETVGGGAVENNKDANVLAKVLLEFANRGIRVRIVSVAHGVALIGSGNRLQDFGMNSGVVVAGEDAYGLHIRTI